MKNLSLVVLCSSFLLLSCGAKDNVEMEVIRDCTGTYLRLDDKDYHVCNIGSLEDKEEGDMVVVNYESIANCEEEPEIVCELYHKNEGWVEVTKVK